MQGFIGFPRDFFELIDFIRVSVKGRLDKPQFISKIYFFLLRMPWVYQNYCAYTYTCQVSSHLEIDETMEIIIYDGSARPMFITN